jgi:hypothetical protein
MCLFYPDCQDVAKEEKARLIGAIGEYLTNNHEVIEYIIIIDPIPHT